MPRADEPIETAAAPKSGQDHLSPKLVSQFRKQLTKGEDVVDPKTWAGSIPAAFGIAPRVRIGANRWFNLLWLIPIGWCLLLLGIAAAQDLRGLPGVQEFIRAIRAPASPLRSRRPCRRGCASSTS